MSAFESELENLLGEFHIRMKGEPQRSERVVALLQSLHSIAARCCPLVGITVFLCSQPLFVSLFFRQVWQVSPGCVQETSTRQVPLFTYSTVESCRKLYRREGLAWTGPINRSTLRLLEADFTSLLSCRSSCVTAASAGS